jgi:hypothetical protein
VVDAHPKRTSDASYARSLVSSRLLPSSRFEVSSSVVVGESAHGRQTEPSRGSGDYCDPASLIVHASKVQLEVDFKSI